MVRGMYEDSLEVSGLFSSLHKNFLDNGPAMAAVEHPAVLPKLEFRRCRQKLQNIALGSTGACPHAQSRIRKAYCPSLVKTLSPIH